MGVIGGYVTTIYRDQAKHSRRRCESQQDLTVVPRKQNKQVCEAFLHRLQDMDLELCFRDTPRDSLGVVT